MTKEVESDVPAVDRLSDLPNDIKNDILSRLNTVDAVQTCVLSKEWRHQWTWLPSLSFSEDNLPDHMRLEDGLAHLPGRNVYRQIVHRKKQAFCKFMDQALQRRANTESPYKLQKLSLYVPSSHEDLAPNLDQWLACAIKCSVAKLNLDADYQVPESIFHVCFLTSLKLSRCKILVDNPQKISLSSLGKLHLSMVNVDQRSLKSIIASCQAIRDLNIVNCLGFDDLEISGVPKLETVHVMGNYGRLKMVVSDAVNLQICTFSGFAVNVATCKSIRYLRLDNAAVTDEQLSLHLSVMHLLEHLALTNCFHLRNVEISAPNLKYLYVFECRLRKANIVAPKLELFVYYAEHIISLSLNVSSLASAAVTIRRGNVNSAIWVASLLKFLTKFNCCKELTLHVTPILNMCIPNKELRSLFHSPLSNVGHLKVQLGFVTVFHPLAETIDTILWLSPRPDSITIDILSSDDDMIKFHFTYSELIESGEEEFSCCSAIPMKCWRHCLKEVKIENLRVWDDVAKLKALFETSTALERIEGLPLETDYRICGCQHRYNSCLFNSTIPPFSKRLKRN